MIRLRSLFMTRRDSHVEIVRVIVVSPGDVAAERQAVVSVVDELNRRVALDKGYQLSVWRWETDSRPGLHLDGPQGLIDERMAIGDADIVIGIFWKRFGTPVADAQSGTEHELRRAWAAWSKRGHPDVMVYFSQQPAAPATSTELEQWHRVMTFREQLPKEQLWWSYSEPCEFERLVRAHLEDVILRRAQEREPLPSSSPVANGRRMWFNVPPLTSSFSGRERELLALEEALTVADRALISQAITGLGGVGKTQLAARYVHSHGSEYDVIAWIAAEDGGVAGLAELAARLGEPVDGLSPAERRDLALEHLGRADERWLLVLDNVASPAQLRDCLPRGGNGRVLVTSRNREVRQFAPLLPLDVFDEATATSYLMERSHRPDDRTGAKQLAGALGYLPLALSHAAAYCATGTSFHDYLELLEALPAEDLFDTSPEVSYAQTVASTWRVSIAAASAEAPLADDVLTMAAYLGPDAIPRSLLTVLIHSGRPIERKKLVDALGALARFSLAAVDDHTLTVHRLLQKVMRDDASARGDDSAIQRALVSLDQAFPTDPSDPAGWPLCEQLLPHVTRLGEAGPYSGDTARRLMGLLNRVCLYLTWNRDDQRLLGLARLAVMNGGQLLGDEHPGTLTARNYEAFAYRRAGCTMVAIARFESLLGDQQRIPRWRAPGHFDHPPRSRRGVSRRWPRHGGNSRSRAAGDNTAKHLRRRAPRDSRHPSGPRRRLS